MEKVKEMVERFVIKNGTVDDCNFLSYSIRDAERAHLKQGIWDIFIGQTHQLQQTEEGKEEKEGEGGEGEEEQEDITIKLLYKCCLIDNCVYFYKRFSIVWDKELNKQVASACGYIYPDCSLSNLIPRMTNILCADFSWSSEEIDNALNRLNFLENALPPNVNWDDGQKTWIIEGVYTDPEYRRQGLGHMVVTAARDAGLQYPECSRCWITCSVGNQAAFRLYQQVGFNLIGDGETAPCEGEVRFHILEYKYPSRV